MSQIAPRYVPRTDLGFPDRRVGRIRPTYEAAYDHREIDGGESGQVAIALHDRDLDLYATLKQR